MAARKSCAGAAWRAIVLLLNAWNLNVGPYRSHAWWRMKQEVLKRFIASHNHHAQAFQDILPWFGELNDTPDTTSEAAQLGLWRKLGNLNSFEELGPVMKLMRWCGLETVHKFYRQEYPALKMVLLEMVKLHKGDTGDDIVTAAAESAKTASTSLGAEEEAFEAVSTMLKTNGKLQTACRAITPRNVDLIDIFVLACTADQRLYEHRASQVKTPTAGLEFNLRQVKGAWRNYFMDLAQLSIHDVPALKKVHAHEATERGRLQARSIMDLVLWIAKCRAEYIQVFW